MVGLLVVAPVQAAATAPRSDRTSPACGLHATLLTVSLLEQDHEQHRTISVAKLRSGWPKMLVTARSAAHGLGRETPVMRRLSTRFTTLVGELEQAGDALRAGEMNRFWATLARTKPDTLAVSSLVKRAKLACTVSDGHGGTLTIGP